MTQVQAIEAHAKTLIAIVIHTRLRSNILIDNPTTVIESNATMEHDVNKAM